MSVEAHETLTHRMTVASASSYDAGTRHLLGKVIDLFLTRSTVAERTANAPDDRKHIAIVAGELNVHIGEMRCKRSHCGSPLGGIARVVRITSRAAVKAVPRVTVAELCRVAGVSRNALYRHHPSVLEALRQHRRIYRLQAQPMAHVSAQLRQENAALRQKLAKLAALVDHYYGAYHETRSLLNRRERELAELRRRLDSRAISPRR